MNQLAQLQKIRNKLVRFMMMYKFALDELVTRIDILNEEFQLLHDFNPIEHTKSRLKTPESIMSKLSRKGGGESFASIRECVKDIAGLRITCSFVSDIYHIASMLRSQSDLNIVEVKDYIQQPKPNGYRSLHLLIEVPVHMSDRREMVYVEVQIRTIAMDFWASLEHKIFYKFDGHVPSSLLRELKEAADSATALDMKMERLHTEVDAYKSSHSDNSKLQHMLQLNNQKMEIPSSLLRLVEEDADTSS